MRGSILTLPWLPDAAPDFSQRVRALDGADPRLGQLLQELSTSRLSGPQALKIAKAMRKARAAGASLAPLSGLRLGVLASATFDLVLDHIPAAAARHGVAAEVALAPYDQIVQQAIDPESGVNRARNDAVLIAADHRWMQLDRADLGGTASARVGQALEKLELSVEGLRRHGGAPAILETVAVPPNTLFGSYDRRMQGSVRAMIEALNLGIAALAEETASYVLDTAALAERVGTDLWFDPVQWASFKLPFASECIPLYADALGRLLGAIRGKARKCLVLDLDNTLWGGVIGDDGLDGITLGQGSARGEAFLAVQRAALELRERGIVLAVSSKNTDEIARRPFREHRDMLLRQEHIAVFQANWLDKPTNLEAIARTLNIGLDALVVLDDNPAERAQIRAALPAVAVPELPSDPAWFTRILMAAGYFEAVSFSAEDAGRAASYASDAQRAEVLARARDVGEYLDSLDMVLDATPFDAQGRQRIVQLINKTNQFNLTTRRTTEADIAAMDDGVFTLQVRLKDKFGDMGMIGVVICRPVDEESWEVDTWLMSCRVLGRRVEQAMLTKIVDAARAQGIARLIGVYLPTAKNAMVSDHYEKLGFTPIADGRFELMLDAFEGFGKLPFAT